MMRNRNKLLLLLLSLTAACGQSSQPQTTANGPTPIGDAALASKRSRVSAPHQDLAADLSPQAVKVCPDGNRLRCFAHARLNKAGKVFAAAAPSGGLGPTEIQSAYNLSGLSSKATVAIVDAYDDPTAEADLAVYRSQYGLPACTTANGCFKKVNQSGQASPLPAAAPSSDDWTMETSLDLDSVSSACPSCKIILVEADDDQGDGLYISQNAAASLGATVISNSWGGGEESDEGTYDATYFATHTGITTFFASGDAGYAASYPPTSPYVVSVGGTTLTQGGSGRGWTETVWNDGPSDATGSGCSVYETTPSWQSGVSTGCSFRASNDVAAAGDPNTGLAVYDTSNGNSGWEVVGGTSMSTPLTAAIFALTGHGAAGPSWIYSNTSAFYDVTNGNDGSCSPAILCTAGSGWDGPSGWGAPNGAALAGGVSGSSSGGGSSSSSSGGGSSSSSSGGGSSSSGGSSGGGSCAHGICSTGAALTSTCDPCANAICAQDDYCCNNAWDSVCVGEVTSICGESCSSGGSGTNSCDHNECTTGSALGTSCDSCAATVCGSDSYCCNTKWDSACVSEASAWCGLSCQ